MRLPLSLHSRLVLSHLLVSVLSVFLISLFAANAILTASQAEVKHNLEDLAFAVSNSLEARFEEVENRESDFNIVKMELARLLANHPELQYTLYLPDGTPIADSSGTLPANSNAGGAPDALDALHNETGQSQTVLRNPQGESIYFISNRIQRGDNAYGVLRMGTALNSSMQAASRSLGVLILVAVLVAIAVSLFAWLLANSLAHPIEDLTQAASRMALGDLSARVSPSGTQELHRLAEAFNIMAGRLETHVDELKAFVANASHELRTPLTVVKLHAEALRDGAIDEPEVANQFLSEIESEVDRLVRMVNDLLDLSRMEAGMISTKRSLINLSAIVTDVYETFRIRADRAGIKLELELEPNLPPIKGNEDQLRRVLYNFTENAIKYTPRGGTVQLILQSGQKGKTVRLLVKDTGIGIPEEHLSHIFERFYRAEATRPRAGISKGSGLGLAIAKSTLESHGGTIGVTSQLGQGTTFWAELPAQG